MKPFFLGPVGPGDFVENIRHLRTLRMVPDENQGRLGWSMVVGVVVGLYPGTYGLQDECVVFPGDCDVALGTEHRLAEGDFGDGLF